MSGLYRAASGDHDWLQALEPVRAAVGARAAVLHTVDLVDGRLVSLQCALDGDPQMRVCEFEYLRHWHLHDPRRARLIALGEQALGRWWHCHDAFDEAFARRNLYYRQFLPAYGLRWHAATVLPHADGRRITGLAFELPTPRGPLTPDERIWADRLGRHMAEALRMSDRVQSLSAQALAGHPVLAGLAHPVWLIDTERRVWYANPAALQPADGVEAPLEHPDPPASLVGSGHALVADAARRSARLRLLSDRADRRLTAKLHALRTAPHGAGGCIDLRLRRDDPPAWLRLQRMDPGVLMSAFGQRPLVLVMHLGAGQAVADGPDPLWLTELFGLTPTQARVAVHLAGSLSAREIAQRLHMAESTVRTHLRAVLAKLGADRMAQAVRMLNSQGLQLVGAKPGA